MYPTRDKNQKASWGEIIAICVTTYLFFKWGQPLG